MRIKRHIPTIHISTIFDINMEKETNVRNASARICIEIKTRVDGGHAIGCLLIKHRDYSAHAWHLIIINYHKLISPIPIYIPLASALKPRIIEF